MQPGPMACLRAGKCIRRILQATLAFALLAPFARAQQTRIPARITQPIDATNRTVLKGNVHPLARAEFDRGAAPASLQLNRMLLVLKPSAEQEAALDALLDEQQDKTSPNYHAWLTPEQFGEQFGPADADVQKIVLWLKSQGFQVNRVANGRGVIEFSGSAGQVQNALHTEIHKYVVNGKSHWANSADPQIPAALAPVVAGIKTLDNFYKQPQVVLTPNKFRIGPGFPPEFSTPSGLHAVAPGDYATIYNINPLYGAGINGTGAKIAVVGRSDFAFQDVTDFRNTFGLSANAPQIVMNGPDPGIVNTGEQLEATLDVSWAGAVAPNAQIIFVETASTATTDGVDLSEEYIVDNDLADVMTESFGGCEAGTTAADAAAISALAKQAAAEGITYMVSTGDSGAEGCDNPNTQASATGPISVNVLASSPYTVAVGGTKFNEGTTPSKYWKSTNSTSLSSAISYIPENVWNESCVSGCGTNGKGSIFAGGGGASQFFGKPSWQSAVAGIPQDGARDLPDVSLTAAGHDPYLLCFQYSCEQGVLAGVGGTSASAPSFAGVMALVNQKTGSRQGQANYVLYRLAAQETFSKCNGSSASSPPASTCIFNDTTVGNNAVPGESGYGTSSAKYQSTSGYDLATGLGSVNVANLVNGWGNARSVTSVTTLSISPSTGVTHGTPLNVTIGVAPASGSAGTPTGDVGLVGDFGSSPSGQTSIVDLTLSNGTASSGSVNQLPGGTYNVQAHYEGDGTFVPSDSTAVQVNIVPEPSTETVAALTGTPPNLVSFTTLGFGAPIYLRATVAGTSGVGVATGTVNFIDATQGTIGSGTLDGTGSVTTFAQQDLTPGSHSITANYAGDANFKTGSSPLVNFTITPGATTTVIQAPSAPLVVGTSSASLQVNVTGSNAGVSPTGTVTGFVGGNQIGNPVPLFSANYGSTGGISLSTQPPGQITVTATYNGDSNYQTSTSSPLTVNLVRQSTTTLTASASSIQASQSVTLTVQIASPQSGPAIAGTVQFVEYGPISSGPIGSPVPVQNGQAQITTTSLPRGSDTIAAIYSGDSNYGPSGATLAETVSPLAATMTVATSNASIQQGQSVILTATVTPSQSGGPVPTGGVSFTVVGAANFSGGSNLNAAGQAVWTTNSLPIGTLTVNVSYAGDTVYPGVTASIVETVVAAPTFTITDNSPAITVTSPGQSGSTTLTFTAQNGLTGSATLMPSMCTNLPPQGTCSFSPSTVAFSSSTTTVPVTLTISTTAASSTGPSWWRFAPGSFGRVAGTSLLVLIMCVFLSIERRRRAWSAVLALTAVGVIAVVVGCGGGGGNNGSGGGTGGGVTNPGTPVGNYTGITVTVTIGSVTQSISSISVNVQ